MNCKVNKPYPKIQVEKENINYAKILLDAYAGSNSEDTAIHEYLYQSFLKEDMASTLKEIAKVEMHHLNILGQLIVKLGYTPFFCTVKQNKVIPWSSNYLNYTLNLKRMLSLDIERERKTIQKYRLAINMINDKYIKEILERIIEDEEMHIKCLHELYKKYK